VNGLTSAPRPGQPALEPRAEYTPAAFDSPRTAWPAWSAPLALVSALVVAVVGALLVDLPAIALGVNLSAQHLPDGLQIADTAVQDLGFVLVAVFFAQLGGRKVAAWQFGLRPTPPWRAALWIVWIGAGFLVFSIAWKAIVHPPEEKVLEQIGTGVLSAALTCVVAPIGEEFLFRGYIFTALRNWRGPWTGAVITGLLFGLVHAGSAPLLDLVPLAALGFALCLLYRRTGSLYPCIVVHSLNNSVAFGDLANWNWNWQIPLLAVASLAVIALLAALLTRVGVIAPERPLAS
jgi:membrane protease YdiL (CAAX protease family)